MLGIDDINKLQEENEKYKNALENIKKMITKPYCCKPQDVLDRINEVLNG